MDARELAREKIKRELMPDSHIRDFYLTWPRDGDD